MSLEVLVHNLSHSDLILGVNKRDLSVASVVARPKFGEFNHISEKLFQKIRSASDAVKLSKLAPHSRSQSNSLLAKYPQVAVGYQLIGQTVESCPIDKLRFRQHEKETLTTEEDSQDLCAIEYVYFPLLSVLVPKWLMTISEGHHRNGRKVIVLVSGRGKPMDEKAREADNSTRFTAKLIQLFLNIAYPHIEVQLLHSNTNLFRYDENIVFVKTELLPKINVFRDQLVAQHGSKWKELMKVTLSFADGTSARINAINASLRHLRPAYMHFWVLKSFWRDRKIYDDDIEYHSFEEVATEPAIPSHESEDPLVRLVIDEMDKFRKDFHHILTDAHVEHDLANFWLRKTKKPVLSVLLVEKKGVTKLYRGTNMEVSMPTGSLCAERNVIGSALADDPTLMRQDIKVIAVYSVNMSATNSSSHPHVAVDETRGQRSDSLPHEPLGHLEALVEPGVGSPTRCLPCASEGSPTDVPLSIAMTEDVLNSANARSPLTGQKRKIFRMTSKAVQDEETDEVPEKHLTLEPPSMEMSSPSKPGSTLRSAKKRSDEHGIPQPVPATESVSKAKKGRKKSIPFSSPLGLQNTTTAHEKEAALMNSIVPTMTTVYVEENDMNPLKPCGACNEWLKKIAEVNPHMKVITFTDANCAGIYVEHIND